MISSSSDNFRRIDNPYIVGNPIKGRKMFFGREEDFAYIKRNVTGGKKSGMLVLCGSRRSGKTSILFQVKDGRLGDEFVPVLIDMQSMTVENDRDFLVKLAAGIVEAIGDPGIISESEGLIGADNPLEVFHKLIFKINDHLAGKKLILLFDEYEIFESHIGKQLISTEILNLFANWIEHKEGLFLIFTGSDKLEERSAEYWERFLGKSLHRRISYLSQSDTLGLIKNPLEGVVTYDEGVPERVFELTAGQPFYTQVFCQTLVDHLNERHSYSVTGDDLLRTTDEIIENPLPQMIFSWSSLTVMEKLALSIIGELTKEEQNTVTPREILAFADSQRIGYKLDEAKLNESLEKLFYHDLLEKDTGTQPSYRFKMDLWRLWISRMHSIWSAVEEIGKTKINPATGVTVADRSKSRSRLWLIAAAGAVIIAATVASSIVSRKSNEPIAVTPPEVVIVDSTHVTIRTTPPNATVIIDGKWAGRSPIEARLLPVTDTPIRIELAGYHDYTDTLRLEKDTPTEKSISLAERTGGFHITSTPESAGIFIDGNNTGLSTPATLSDLSVTRRHRIQLRLTGFNAGIIDGAEVIPDSVITLHHSFSKRTAPLTIVSNPVGAEIILDGQLVGTTPKNLTSIAHGSHSIELRKVGYGSRRADLEVPAPDHLFEASLDKLPPGTLIIQAQPYAELWINGVLREEYAVFLSVPLDAGNYEIELRHPQHENIRKTLTITSQDTVRVQHRFGEK
jgi:hypothetical protein